MLVQAVPATANSVTVELRMTGATNVSRTFTEYTNATVGDTVSFSWTVDVDSDIANASDIYIWIPIEGIANNFDTEGPNNDGTNLDVMQLDNIGGGGGSRTRVPRAFIWGIYMFSFEFIVVTESSLSRLNSFQVS